jgi:predicted aminopeptidase
MAGAAAAAAGAAGSGVLGLNVDASGVVRRSTTGLAFDALLDILG